MALKCDFVYKGGGGIRCFKLLRNFWHQIKCTRPHGRGATPLWKKIVDPKMALKCDFVYNFH